MVLILKAVCLQNISKKHVVVLRRVAFRLAFIGLLAWSFKPLFTREIDRFAEKNRLEAESIAYQILQIHQQASKQDGGARGPASVSDAAENTSSATDGKMGKDPWGDAYLYNVSKGPAGELVSVEVWSTHDPDRVVLKIK